MANTTFINRAEGLPVPQGIWSHVAISEPGRMVFICGVVAKDVDGNLVGKGDMGAQTRQTCENVKAAVEAAGGTLSDIVRVDVYTTDIEEFDAIHAVRREYFPNNPPVSTMVEITRLVHPDAWIEINAIAVLALGTAENKLDTKRRYGSMKVYPYGVGDVVTRVHEDGAGDNVVVLCHGVGARGDRWRYNIPVLAEAGYHCYALDNPGHGFATKGPNFPYGVPGFAGFIADFIRSTGHSAVHLIGTSMGGHNSATIACRHPEMVKSLILVGATGLFRLGDETTLAISGRIGDTTRDGINGKLSSLIHHDDKIVTDEWRDEEYRVNNSPGASDAFAALADYFRTSIDNDAVGEELAKHADKIPIMLLWGTEDVSVPLSVGKKAQEVLGGPPLVEMTECAHAPYLEDPDTFNKAVLDFLNKQS